MATVSIKDVAARAGVSLGTVSNVLNRPAAVRAATRARVEAAIAELGFVPNASARQLAAGRSRTIAYLVLDADEPLLHRRRPRHRGGRPRPRASPSSSATATRTSTARTSTSSSSPSCAPAASSSRRWTTPTPGFSGSARPACPSSSSTGLRTTATSGARVGVDDVAGGGLAISHLVEAGHTRLAFVGGPADIPQVRDRHVGAVRATAAADLPEDALTWIRTTALTIAEGRRAGERLLGLPRRTRPTGIFCANDLLALGLLQHLTQHGVSVPHDVAIVGYDDIEFAAAAAVPLTSVSQPRHLLGQTAARLLADEADPSTKHEHQHVVFPPELVARASTATGSTARRPA